MVVLATVLISVLTNFLTPIGLTGGNTEGSERFGLVVEDPRELTDEQALMPWRHCP
jgi:hypothetical protein